LCEYGIVDEEQARSSRSGCSPSLRTIIGAHRATPSAPPPHEHPWDEAYYVLEGSTRFQVGDRHLEVHQGDFLYAPAGTVHAFVGASKQPARLLIFDAPAAAEAFFRDAAAEIPELPRDLQKVPEIGARHRLRFLVP
jgi:mannose-6-phosphate isomerase-like protein (cupin superfamily)